MEKCPHGFVTTCRGLVAQITHSLSGVSSNVRCIIGSANGGRIFLARLVVAAATGSGGDFERRAGAAAPSRAAARGREGRGGDGEAARGERRDGGDEDFAARDECNGQNVVPGIASFRHRNPRVVIFEH